jgi:lysophospholipase L1-like esterase
MKNLYRGFMGIKRREDHLLFPQSSAVLFVLAATLIAGSLFPFTSARASTAAPGKPTSISGTAGDQQVTLSWGAVDGATGYLIDETNLVTGKTTQLPTVVTTTSFTPGGLLVGHWYRFSVIPLAGTIQGPASAPIEIRTTGFSGSYQHYYAFGDSYSSGDGAPPYEGAQGCYRSKNGYPYLLGSGVPTPILIACAGAVLANIDQTVQSSSLPGIQLSQLPANLQGNTLITITIGGNDIGFADELTKCITSLTSCTSDKTSLSQKIAALQPRLLQVYQKLHAAAPGADIIIVGYPLVVADPAIADCHNPVVYYGLGASEMQMIRDLASQLDNTIAAAASQAGIFSATKQVEQAFAGHEICTADESQEWINEVAGLNDALHDSFHPNSAGDHGYAEAINSARKLLYQNGMV